MGIYIKENNKSNLFLFFFYLGEGGPRVHKHRKPISVIVSQIFLDTKYSLRHFGSLLLWEYLLVYLYNKGVKMMYIIMKEKYYQGIENSYDIVDYTDNEAKANDMLQGYQLINQDKHTKYQIVKYNPMFVYKKDEDSA